MRKILTVLSLLVALLLISLPQSIRANDDIRVLSSTIENKFPNEVLFGLEAESSKEIKKITLFYRVGISTASNYAYPTFSPGRAIKAQYSLKTSGSSYIPPGTELEYYYGIEDSEGGSLKTDPKTFLYLDTRFQWREIKEGLISVNWYGREEATAQKALKVATQTMAKMAREAGARSEKPVRIYVYSSRDEMNVAIPFRSETTTRDIITLGEFFDIANLVMILGRDPDIEATTAHELTHLITHELTDNPYGAIPAWLNEGLSTYAEGGLRGFQSQDLLAAIRQNRLLSIRSISSQPGRPELVGLFYGQAGSIVKYLVETYGAEKMAELLKTFKQGSTTEDALKKVYGFDVDGLEAKWRASIGAPPAAPGGAQQPQAGPQTVPTLVPFGTAPQPAPSGAGAQEGRLPLEVYLGLAFSVVVVSFVFLFFITRRSPS